jgi:hypothetical protein
MPTPLKTVRLDIDAAEFQHQLVDILNRGGVSFQQAVRNAVITGMSRQLDELATTGTCLGYAFKNGNQSRIVSLREATAEDGFDFWYLDLQIDLVPGSLLSEKQISKPNVMRWIPIDYGSGVRKAFKFKHTKMKTRERYEIQIVHPHVPATLLKAVLQQFKKNCPCSPQHLTPISAGVWEWRQAFGCVLCGEQYFCDCFRTAIVKAQQSELSDYCDFDSDKVPEIANEPKYRKGICHLCTGTPSNLVYCSPMYGSVIKQRYGAYIEKFRIAEDLSARDAENKVRGILNLPHIGDGWINETQLFNFVKVFFASYEVVREASPSWLGNQRIDIFVPALSLAIEYQGQQHFQPVKRFGGDTGFLAAQLRDKRKRHLCKENDVALVYFTHAEELSIERVEQKLSRYLPASDSQPSL